jgi:PAS domain S-box-containing protein
MTTGSQVVFQTSPDAMVALDKDAIIENTNPAATALFGFTPEQLLGQNVALLIPSDVTTNTPLFSTIKLMLTGQTSMIFETDVAGSRDDETNVPLRVVLIGFATNDKTADSFSLICRDLTEEKRDRDLMDRTKREADRLLHALIPPEMLSKIANHELSFAVPIASVLVINISQLPEYMSIVSPPKLLQNLKKIFEALDQVLSDFPSLKKLKVMGDIYIAAGGLFCTDRETMPWTMDLLHFSIRCLETVDEMNIQLNTSLQLKIGLHTGGPLFVGVVADKNNLNVIGGPISCAMELERVAEPGTIILSATTYESIAAGAFQIDPHGEVDLGDFGKQMTYMVSLKRIRTYSSRYNSQMGSILGRPEVLSHGSLFQVPSLEMLMGSMAGGYGAG